MANWKYARKKAERAGKLKLALKGSILSLKLDVRRSRNDKIRFLPYSNGTLECGNCLCQVMFSFLPQSSLDSLTSWYIQKSDCPFLHHLPSNLISLILHMASVKPKVLKRITTWLSDSTDDTDPKSTKNHYKLQLCKSLLQHSSYPIRIPETLIKSQSQPVVFLMTGKTGVVTSVEQG